jgi:hypothetical protein
MKSTMIISAFAIALTLTAPVGASPAVATPVAMTPAPTFEQADANKDGAVSRDEAVAAKALHNTSFDTADQNKDGRLSKVEYDAAIKASTQQGG